MNIEESRQSFSYANEKQIQSGASFKSILYKQKQLVSFIISFSNIVAELQDVSDSQAQHLYVLCLLAVRQHASLYERYRSYLYDALVSMVVALSRHPRMFFLWLKRYVAEALCESLKLPENVFMSLADYYTSLKSTSLLWQALLMPR